jgi:hypothetical protein
MTTARTHRRNTGRGSHRPNPAATPKPVDGFVPISAEAWPAAAESDQPEPEAQQDAEPFDPADHTVDEVKAFVTANPETAGVIAEVELFGKARSGLLAWLEAFELDQLT